ncbi:wall-associated receptor kinase carboxy-terminal protein, partial [Trifolium medium]|nr:wall-associated receptor kinase carboxy-terminal protein [Trifolium medium]
SQVISCLIEGEPRDAYLVSRDKVVDFMVLECKNNITVPGLKSSVIDDSDIVANVLDEGFEVRWSGLEENICDGCMKSGGRCGYNVSDHAIMCLCSNQQSYGDCGFCRPNSSAGILLDESDCKKQKKLFKSVAPSPIAAPSNGLTPSRASVPPSSMHSFFTRYVIRFF